jgi:competence protein ComEC
LDEETLQAYVSAGAMHVLSVSGLHVALVFQLLTWMLGFMQFDKVGKWLYYILSLMLIWGYAILTGLCPSVMRSVVMFTIILIGQATNKNNNTINSIGFSAFLLLLYNPMMLMDVGFQLSYLAVLGIVYLQPKIYSWFEIKNGFGDWAWQITSVSIAAQLITFPLGILYFHQFPTYFLLTNLIVIPASTVMLYGGIGLFVVYWIPFISNWYGFLLEKFTWLVNEYLVWNQQLPGSVVEGIFIENWEAWMMFSILSLALLTIEHKRFYYIPILFLFTLVISVQAGKRKIESTSNLQFSVYHIPKKTSIEWIEGKNSILLTDLEPNNYQGKFKFHIRNNHIQNGVEKVQFVPIDFNGKAYPCGFSSAQYTVFVRNGKTLLVIKKPINNLDSLIGVLRPDVVVFARNSLKGLLKFNPLLPEGVKYVADGSNREYINKEVLQKYPLFYLTSASGYFKD